MIRASRTDRPSRRVQLHPTLDRLEGRALMATAGSLDPTFGGTGYYATPISPSSGGATIYSNGLTAVAVESDGSVVAGGKVGPASAPTYGLIRLSVSGTGNVVNLPLPSGFSLTVVSQIVISATGKIDVAGMIVNNSGTTTVSEDIIAQLYANGAPDSSFGAGGVVVLGPGGVDLPGVVYNLTGGDATGHGIAVQSDGKIIAVGYVPVPGSTNGSSEIALIRLDTDGALDPTFGTDGLLASAFGQDTTGAFDQRAETVSIAPGGQIVLGAILFAGGFVPTPVGQIFRLNADGSQDTSLGESGLQSTGILPSQVQVQPDGKILVLGTIPLDRTTKGALARLNTDGTLDATATFPLAYQNNTYFYDFALQGDGKVDVVGDGLFRLTSALTPDNTFGTSATATSLDSLATAVPGETSVLTQNVAIGPDDAIIAVGVLSAVSSQVITTQSDFVARLIPAGPTTQAGDFDGDGISDPAIYLPASGSFAIKTSTQPPGEIVQFGTAGPGQSIPVLGDFYGTNQDDIAVYLTASGSFAVQDPTGETAGEVVQFGTAGQGNSIPAPGDYYGTGQADIAVYLPATGTFAIQDPTGATNGKVVQLGIAGTGQSIPVPGDYYGTGQTDLAVYLPASRTWAIQDPTGRTTGQFVPFGMPGLGNSIPVPGDYDGSGKTELAVYIPSLAELIYRPANGGADVTMPFGVEGIGQTLPAPGDYDGLGKTEVAAYIPDQGLFAYRPASGGPDVDDYFGSAGPGQSIPVTSVVLSPFPGTNPGSGNSFAAPGVMGEPDSLDFLPTTAKKSKAGDSSGTVSTS